MSDKFEYEGLDEIAEREISFHLRNRSSLHLEAAIGSMLDCYTLEETASRLELEAKMLRDFG